MTFAGDSFVNNNFAAFIGKKINGYDIIEPNSNIITTKVGDDPRQGANPSGLSLIHISEPTRPY